MQAISISDMKSQLNGLMSIAALYHEKGEAPDFERADDFIEFLRLKSDIEKQLDALYRLNEKILSKIK